MIERLQVSVAPAPEVYTPSTGGCSGKRSACMRDQTAPRRSGRGFAPRSSRDLSDSCADP